MVGTLLNSVYACDASLDLYGCDILAGTRVLLALENVMDRVDGVGVTVAGTVLTVFAC